MGGVSKKLFFRIRGGHNLGKDGDLRLSAGTPNAMRDAMQLGVHLEAITIGDSIGLRL